MTPATRTRSLLATSEKARSSALERRGEPLTLGKEVKAFGVIRMPYRDLLKLKIDPTYQREEITRKVNELIHVIKNGGIIPDPITVAQRPNGDHYIVDGQQRWWASIDCETALEAKVIRVPDYESEVKLFHILNNQAGLGGTTRIRSWPGKAGEVLHELNDRSDSPLRCQISFKASTGVRAPAGLLLRGLIAATSGVTGGASVTTLLQRYDYTWSVNPLYARAATEAFAVICAQVFDDDHARSMRQLPVIALGKLCYLRWKDADPKRDTLTMPSPRQIEKLRQIEWRGLIPSSAIKWLPVVEAEIIKVWPGKAA